MGFLSPWFLAGLTAIALPVWFHLLKKHKATPLYFSSLMFFERRTQSSVKHRRLQYLLLFGLRTALLAMLALAFASPFITTRAAPGAGGRKMTVLAIDDSFSMRQGGRLDRAKREALGVLARLGGADEAQVVVLAGNGGAAAAPGRDHAALRGAIESIKPSDSRGTYGELAQAVRSIAGPSALPVEAHLFSDMQRTALPPDFADLELPAGTALVVHSVADRRVPNWTVENVSTPRHLSHPNKARVEATIAGFGAGAASLRVSLRVNQKTLETRTVNVPAGGRATVEFLSLAAPYGLSRGEVRIESADAFRNDDAFLFAIERAESRPVLFLHDPRDARAPLYFRAALESSLKGVFSLETRSVHEAPGIDLSPYAFVVLSNVSSSSPALEERLERYVRQGGSALIALGPAAAARGAAPLVGVTKQKPGALSQVVTWVDAAHPALRGANRWQGVRFYRAVGVDLRDGEVLARLSDQTPVLFERRLGAGRLLVFASTLDNISNDFPLHASFVPFVQHAANYLGGLDDRGGSMVVDAFLELRRSRESGTPVEVLGPQGQRVLSLAESSSAQDVGLREAGFYEVRRGNGGGELVAVNPDRRESDLDFISEETLSLWQNTGNGARSGSERAEAQPESRNLWWYVMLAGLVLALAESLVGSRYLTARKEAM